MYARPLIDVYVHVLMIMMDTLILARLAIGFVHCRRAFVFLGGVGVEKRSHDIRIELPGSAVLENYSLVSCLRFLYLRNNFAAVCKHHLFLFVSCFFFFRGGFMACTFQSFGVSFFWPVGCVFKKRNG